MRKVWRSAPLETVLLKEADRLVGDEAGYPVIDDTALPKKGSHSVGVAVHELREHVLWSEGQVWCSLERHGQITGIMKVQIDHLPLEFGGMRPTQGRTLAVMQVSGRSQSFNAVNTLRLLGR